MPLFAHAYVGNLVGKFYPPVSRWADQQSCRPTTCYTPRVRPDLDTIRAQHQAAVRFGEQSKLHAVLHIPPVDSPEAAVRTTLVSDYKEGSHDD